MGTAEKYPFCRKSLNSMAMGEGVRDSKATLLLKELELSLCFQAVNIINLACYGRGGEFSISSAYAQNHFSCFRQM